MLMEIMLPVATLHFHHLSQLIMVKSLTRIQLRVVDANWMLQNTHSKRFAILFEYLLNYFTFYHCPPDSKQNFILPNDSYPDLPSTLKELDNLAITLERLRMESCVLGGPNVFLKYVQASYWRFLYPM